MHERFTISEESGSTWLKCARSCERAGCDAFELTRSGGCTHFWDAGSGTRAGCGSNPAMRCFERQIAQPLRYIKGWVVDCHRPANRPAVLLLGDSRGRTVFRDQVGPWCTEEADDAEDWAAPADVSTHVASATTCKPYSPFDAFGFFLHYGVSSDGHYHHTRFGWRDHGHNNWGGPGWEDPKDENADPKIDSRALATEAARRFVAWARRGALGPVVVVVTSMVWDIFRKAEWYPSQSREAWGIEYQRNYSLLAQNVLREVGSDGMVLLSTSSPLNLSSYNDELSEDVAMHVRQVHKALGKRYSNVHLLDTWASSNRFNRGSLLMDDIHPNKPGTRIDFRLLTRTLQDAQPQYPECKNALYRRVRS